MDWNRQIVLFAHGYSTPTGEPDEIALDPVAEDPSQGLLSAAYQQGFAVGHSAYNKRGFAVASGIENTIALKRFADAFGSTRAYITGGSMGGSITALISQRYPQDFAGALAACGVVSDWTYVLDYASHVRALYNYFSANTPYALPGSQDVTRTVTGLTKDELMEPIISLYANAQADPEGQAAQILERTLSAVPNVLTRPDLTSLLNTVVPQAFGIEDFSAAVGGLFIENQNTVYKSELLSESENVALNAGIQRYSADPSARAAAIREFSTSGYQPIPLLTIHNAYDPLVVYEHEDRLRRRTAEADQLDNLAQRTVPAMGTEFPLPGLEGVTISVGAAHCGFTQDQIVQAWNDLRAWVEEGVNPAESFRTNLDH